MLLIYWNFSGLLGKKIQFFFSWQIFLITELLRAAILIWKANSYSFRLKSVFCHCIKSEKVLYSKVRCSLVLTGLPVCNILKMVGAFEQISLFTRANSMVLKVLHCRTKKKKHKKLDFSISIIKHFDI